MVNYLRPIGALLLCGCISLQVPAQDAARRIVGISSDTVRYNTATLEFDKSLNTYHWTGVASYRNTAGPFFLQMNEQFLSTLIRTDRKLVTDNQNIDLRMRYRLGDRISAASNVSSFILSDNKGLGGNIGKASSHGIYGGFAYQPFDQLTIEPLVGVRFDKQLDRQDNGLSFILGIASDTLNYAGYYSRLRGTFQYEKIDPRTLETYNAQLKINKIFFEQTRNYLQFSYFRNRRDFYLPADSILRSKYNISYNIESRADNSFAVTDSLNYNIDKTVLWTFQGNIFTREIDRTMRYRHPLDPARFSPNTITNELKIEGSVRAKYILNSRLNFLMGFGYMERDEKHRSALADQANLPAQSEERKNNHSRITGFVGAATWNLSSSDTIAFSGSANILRYDTPSELNDDDRDELWYLFNISTRHRFNKHLMINIAADINLTHLVYLFSARSADNNWNRIIRLAPSVYYSPSETFRSANTFEALANYTVYDFEYLSSQTRSYSFRQFAFVDSSYLSVTHRLGFDWFSYIRYYERGEFRWNSFTERPVNYFEDKTLIGSVRYLLQDGLLFSVGIRYFSQLRFGYIGRERNLENYLRSAGPTTSIEIIAGNTNLMARGCYESQSQTGQPNRGFTTMVLSLNVRI